MWNLNYYTNELIYKTETVLQDTKNRLVVAKGKGDEGELNQEFGMNRGKLSHMKWINSKAPLYNMLFPVPPSIYHEVVDPLPQS